MKLADYRGYEITLPMSGGKAGKGKQKTSSIQVRVNGFLIHQTRFRVDNPAARKSALERAKLFLDARIKLDQERNAARKQDAQA